MCAKWVLPTPATSTSSERVFSMAGRTLDDRRSHAVESRNNRSPSVPAWLARCQQAVNTGLQTVDTLRRPILSLLGVTNNWNLCQFVVCLFDYVVKLVMLITKKTVCMIFNPSERKKVVSCNFPVFTANGEELSYASSFKYLGNVITNDLRDDADIEREIKCLFTRCNILLSRFQYCSKIVKLRLFQSYCLCFYNPALWFVHNKTTISRFVRSLL